MQQLRLFPVKIASAAIFIWNFHRAAPLFVRFRASKEATMNGIIYIIGLIVVILAILSFFGLR